MKKIESPFTEEELQLLRSSFRRIGKKHQVSGEYVGLIGAGKRQTNTKTAKAILKDLKQLLKLLKPNNDE